jgi:hypothetical protein
VRNTAAATSAPRRRSRMIVVARRNQKKPSRRGGRPGGGAEEVVELRAQHLARVSPRDEVVRVGDAWVLHIDADVVRFAEALLGAVG